MHEGAYDRALWWQVRRRDRAYGKVMQARARTDARAFKVRM